MSFPTSGATSGTSLLSASTVIEEQNAPPPTVQEYQFELPHPSLDVLLYNASNICVLLAGILLLQSHLQSQRRSLHLNLELSEPDRLVVARDVEVLLFLGTFLRAYWSTSPPAVWSGDLFVTKLVAWLELSWSVVLWTVCCNKVKRFPCSGSLNHAGIMEGWEGGRWGGGGRRRGAGEVGGRRGGVFA